MLFLTFETLIAAPDCNHPLYVIFVRRILACLTGLARYDPLSSKSLFVLRICNHLFFFPLNVTRAPAGQDETLQKLFDSFFQTLARPSQTSQSKGNSFQKLLGQNDELLTLFAGLIRDYAEYQLSRLYDSSAKLLYSTVAMILFIYQRRLSAYQSFQLLLPSEQQTQAATSRSHQEIVYEENLEFINDSLALLLEILNHLSTKEFLFSDYPLSFPSASNASNSSPQTDLQDIPSVLIFGLQMMIPLIQIPIIYSCPQTLERYLSFILFLCNSSIKSLMVWWDFQLSAETSSQYFLLLMKQLLLAMSVIDSTTARMALQVRYCWLLFPSDH